MYAGTLPDADSTQVDLPLVSTIADESDLSPIIRRTRPRVAAPGSGVLLRAAFAVLTVTVLGALAIPAMAGTGMPESGQQAASASLRLRGDVTANGDTLTFADLIEGAPPALAARPLFRSPPLGATGTIQTRRIAEAAAALGVTNIETGGRMQIAVQRAARRLGPPEIEAALKRGLESTSPARPPPST